MSVLASLRADGPVWLHRVVVPSAVIGSLMLGRAFGALVFCLVRPRFAAGGRAGLAPLRCGPAGVHGRFAAWSG